MQEHGLRWLNCCSPTASTQLRYCEQLPILFSKQQLTILEIGSAYGGAVEMMAKVIGSRGRVYGYDTFVGHPKDLADDQTSSEAICMDVWYKHKLFGLERLDYGYQRKILDKQGLDNAILVKGRINEHSFDDIEKIHMAMIDLDLIKSTKVVYEAIKDKVVKNGYLLMHDTMPDCLPLIYKYLHEVVLEDGRWMIDLEVPKGYLTVLKKL